MELVDEMKALLKEALGYEAQVSQQDLVVVPENGRYVEAALKHEASMIFASDWLVRRIMQDRQFKAVFHVADGVEVYGPKGNALTLKGVIGRLNNTGVVVHNSNIIAHTNGKMLVVLPKGVGNVFNCN